MSFLWKTSLTESFHDQFFKEILLQLSISHESTFSNLGQHCHQKNTMLFLWSLLFYPLARVCMSGNTDLETPKQSRTALPSEEYNVIFMVSFILSSCKSLYVREYGSRNSNFFHFLPVQALSFLTEQSVLMDNIRSSLAT